MTAARALAVALAAATLGAPATAPAATPAATPSEPAAREVATPADRELLDRVYAESGASRSAAAPGPRRYLSHLVGRLFGSLLRWLERSQVLGGGARLAWFVALLLSAAGVALGLVLLARAVLRRSRRAPPTGAATDVVVDTARPAPPDASAWRRTLEERLAAADPLAALEATWWWLARTIAGGRADPAWTSRELARWAGRPDLAALLSAADALAFRATPPTLDEVRGLVGRVEAALA